ncbi:hypothetical protein OAA60_03435 [Porticoccaceae bacterium]|nr:hypothetical protein [Porticoccaceae bacterium]
MKEYTKEQFDQVPDFMQEDYVLDGDTYKHAGVMKMKGTLNDLNSKLETQKGEYTSLNERLTGFESTKAAEIEEATARALEKAHKDNDVDAILKIEREKLTDQQKRFDESSSAFDLRMKEVAGNQKKSAAQSLTNELATDKGKKAFNRLIESYISVDPATGLETYLNDDGSASSLNREQFISEIAKNDLFSTLVKANINVNGGGGMNGSDGSGAPTGTPSTLEECKGDRKLEAAYFNKQMTG